MNLINNVEPLVGEENSLAQEGAHVHKFGGSSLASKECIERVVNIITKHCKPDDFVVVSANGKTTDALVTIYQQALENNKVLEESINRLKTAQLLLINDLVTHSSECLIELFTKDIQQLISWVVKDNNKKNNVSLDSIKNHEANILALGEVWSARLLSAVLNERVYSSCFIDSRDFLIVNNDKDCEVDERLSKQKLLPLLANKKLAVITGYIAQNAIGENCTLGRNGSDYSATIVASLIGAPNVTLWTDVDGIYTADPRIVPLARKLHQLPNCVAKELGRLGNSVLHSKTLQPLENHSTYLHIASSFAPSTSGTEIGGDSKTSKTELSITYLNDLVLAKSASLTGVYGEQAVTLFAPITSNLNAGVIVITQDKQTALNQWLASYNIEVLFMPVSIIATVGYEISTNNNIKTCFNNALKDQQPLYIESSVNPHSLIAVLPEVCTSEIMNNVHHAVIKDKCYSAVTLTENTKPEAEFSL